MREWFDNLQPRERWVLTAGAAVAVIIIAWGFIWTPLAGAAAALRQDVADKQRLLVNLQRLESMPAAQAPVPRGRDTSLLVVVERTHQAHGLGGAFTRTQPDGADAIVINFQNAAFDNLAAWLIALNTQHQVTVQSASFSGARQEGLVTGSLSLRRN